MSLINAVLVDHGKIVRGTTEPEGSLQPKTLETPLTIDGVQKTTVESALDGLNDYADDINDQLLYKNDTVISTNNAPYLQRQALIVEGASPYVKEKLVGASAVVNQLIPNNDFIDATKWASTNSTITCNNGILRLTMTQSSSASLAPVYISFIKDHKYVVIAKINNPSGRVVMLSTVFQEAEPLSSQTSITFAMIGSRNADASYDYPRILFMNAEVNEYIEVTSFYMIDLTALFGSSTIPDYLYNLEQTTAGAGIAKLKEWGFLTKDYYAYNPGGLQSVKCSGKKVVGKNLSTFTAKSVLLKYATVPNFIINGDTIISNFGLAYTISDNGIIVNGRSDRLIDFWVCDIDNNIVDKNVLLSGCSSGSNSTYCLYVYNSGTGRSFNYSGDTEYTPKSGDQLYLRLYANYETSNLSIKPMIRFADIEDSTYEPYSSITYPTSPIDLRGLYDIDNDGNLYCKGDEYNADGSISRKYSRVHLGSLTWSYDASNLEFVCSDINVKTQTGMICSKYITQAINSWSDLNDKCITRHPAIDNIIRIKDLDYTDATLFTNSLDGVYLIYELATPTTESTTSFTSPQSLDNVTIEEYLDNRDYPLPVGHITDYMGPSDELVEMPSTPLDGEYVLKNTVSGGKGQLTWGQDVMAIIHKCGCWNRGKDITSYVLDGTLWDRIAGTNGFKPYEDIYPWDYIQLDKTITAPTSGGGSTTGTNIIRVAQRGGINPYQYNGNCLVMVPDTHFGMSKMNASHTTEGGYAGSLMFTTILPDIDTQLETTIIKTHIRPTTELISTAINATGMNRFDGTSNQGCASNWAWTNGSTYAKPKTILMSEAEVYGSIVWSSSGYDTGDAWSQLEAFRNDRMAAMPYPIYYWLKDIASAQLFASAYGGAGGARYDGAGSVRYARPRFLIS